MNTEWPPARLRMEPRPPGYRRHLPTAGGFLDRNIDAVLAPANVRRFDRSGRIVGGAAICLP